MKEYKIGDKVTFQTLSATKTGKIVTIEKNGFYKVKVGGYNYFVNIKDIK